VKLNNFGDLEGITATPRSRDLIRPGFWPCERGAGRQD